MAEQNESWPAPTTRWLSIDVGGVPLLEVAPSEGLHVGAAAVAERAAHDRVPRPSGPPGRGSFADHVGRVADPPAGRGEGKDPCRAAAGVRLGPQPGEMVVAAPEAGRAVQR